MTPRVRKDGRCAYCRGPRNLANLKRVYLVEAERDPFCSRDCCVAWHRKRAAKESAA